MDVKKET